MFHASYLQAVPRNIAGLACLGGFTSQHSMAWQQQQLQRATPTSVQNICYQQEPKCNTMPFQ
jgi:hypothetical protein